MKKPRFKIVTIWYDGTIRSQVNVPENLCMRGYTFRAVIRYGRKGDETGKNKDWVEALFEKE